MLIFCYICNVSRLVSFSLCMHYRNILNSSDVFPSDYMQSLDTSLYYLTQYAERISNKIPYTFNKTSQGEIAYISRPGGSSQNQVGQCIENSNSGREAIYCNQSCFIIALRKNLQFFRKTGRAIAPPCPLCSFDPAYTKFNSLSVIS